MEIEPIARRLEELQGELTATQCLLMAVVGASGPETRSRIVRELNAEAEAARTMLLASNIGDRTLDTFELTVRALAARSSL